MKGGQFEKGECLYANPLNSKQQIQDWILEGKAKVSFDHNRLHLENELDTQISNLKVYQAIKR